MMKIMYCNLDELKEKLEVLGPYDFVFVYTNYCHIIYEHKFKNHSFLVFSGGYFSSLQI